MAARAQALKAGLWAHGNYQLRLDRRRVRIEWVAHAGEHSVVHAVEPHVDWRVHWKHGLMSMPVPEGLP